jgi:hypothetical protein
LKGLRDDLGKEEGQEDEEGNDPRNVTEWSSREERKRPNRW